MAGFGPGIGIGLGHADRALSLDPDDPSSLELRGTLLYWRYLLNLIPDEDEADDVSFALLSLRLGARF